MTSNLVDVLIVNYRTPDLTARAVQAVAGNSIRIRIWDNSDDCPTFDGAEVYGDHRNRYFAEGNNRLFEMGHAPFVLLLNPDVELAPETLLVMVRRLAASPVAWGITPRLVDGDGLDQNYLHGMPTTAGLLCDRLPPLRPLFRKSYAEYRSLYADLRAVTRVEQPPAAALLLRRSEQPPSGPFDEAYPLFFNDVDLARRLNAGGSCIYAGDLTAHHLGGASLRKAGARHEPIGAMYDAALLHYARRHLGAGYVVLRVAVLIRRAIDTVRGGWWQ